jgi:rubrerythrin
MQPLKGTKTHDSLKAAFAGESQANRRYLYFAANSPAHRFQKALDPLSD